MPTIKTDLERHFYAALKRITQYDTPERLRKSALQAYGLDNPGEALGYAYENMQQEAKHAIKGVRLPKS